MSRACRGRAIAILLGFALGLARGGGDARANPFDVLGLTSRRAAQAGTGAAAADDASALYYNPAGLVTHPALELSIGTIGAYAHLRGAGRLPDPLGGQLALRAPLPLRGPLANRIVVGLALHLLPRDVVHVIAPGPDEGFYPYYGDRMSRIVVMPGAAVRFGRLSIGASVDVLAGLGGSISASEGATRAIDARVDERISTVMRGIVGATWQATPCLRVGAVFRQRFEVPFATAAQTMVAGEPIDLDLRAAGSFEPHQLVIGAAWSRGHLALSADARYARWSDYEGPYVAVDSVLPLVGDVPALEPHVPFADTIGVRAGGELRLGTSWIARAGYGFETSPVPATQTGVTNLLDGPRHTIAIGGGRELGHGMRIDVHLRIDALQSRTLDKKLDDGNGEYDPFTSLRDEDLDTPGLQITNPGFPNPLHGGGQVISGGVTLEAQL